MKRAFLVLLAAISLTAVASLAHADKLTCLQQCVVEADRCVDNCMRNCPPPNDPHFPQCALQCRAQWLPCFQACATNNCGVVVLGSVSGGVGTQVLNVNSQGGTYYLTARAWNATVTVKLGNLVLASGPGIAPIAVTLPAGNQPLTVQVAGASGSVDPSPWPSNATTVVAR